MERQIIVNETKLIYKWWFWVVVGIVIIIVFNMFSGNIKYQCQNGEVADSISKCPSVQSSSVNCPICTKTIEANVIKYQCSDGSIKDNQADCSLPKQTISSKPIVLSGSNNQVTDKFYLSQGLVIFKNSYKGEGNFIAQLIDEDGDYVSLVANTIGTSETSSSAKIENEGYYRIEVTASSGSHWTIKVE